uniref:endonuclease domain-containing 1 protein-like n=1 Tax=Euleptes europaea TaxID=460621 RepID=UPI002541225E|nr:endonuclease domain-containing 1 protein-like [Euleptes europaea]
MLLPALLLILASSLTPGNNEVVTSFSSCLSFFLDNTVPDDALEPSDPARICQKYENNYYFATMYDKTNRIPAYSAYVYRPSPGRALREWMVEPQLVNSDFDSNMISEKDCSIPKDELSQNQAIDSDYGGAPYYVDRGHLNPMVHQFDEASKTATCTLTNIVPQYNKLNQEPWVAYETKTMEQKQAQYKCTKIYALVGAVPGITYIAGGRVNYPSHLWAAACCVTGANRWSWGILASNNYTLPPAVTEYSLRDLELQLAPLYEKTIDLFHSSCY